MGYIVKPKSIDIYEALIHIYPSSFRRQYSTTMVQTFDDMLSSENGVLGRLKVWTRALMDLPFSAAKEHLNNGREIKMNRTSKLILVGAMLAILFVGGASFWLGNIHARNNEGVERATVVQLADAMQQDHFFSDYGSAAILFNGIVSNVKHGNNATLVTFVTNRPYSVTCQFPTSLQVNNGQTLSIASPGGRAERQSAGVLLHDCVEN